jgi:hypothetical protein
MGFYHAKRCYSEPERSGGEESKILRSLRSLRITLQHAPLATIPTPLSLVEGEGWVKGVNPYQEREGFYPPAPDNQGIQFRMCWPLAFDSVLLNRHPWLLVMK